MPCIELVSLRIRKLIVSSHYSKINRCGWTRPCDGKLRSGGARTCCPS